MEWKLFRVVPIVFCVLFFAHSLYGVDDCSICLEPLDAAHGEVVCLNCDPGHPERNLLHRFHAHCLDPLRNETNSQECSSCPICRKQNVAILPLPPEPTSCITYYCQTMQSNVAAYVATTREWARTKSQDIQQQLMSNSLICGLWQARNAAFAGAASALVYVPYAQGVAASGVVGGFRPNAPFEDAWQYPAAFSIGYGVARIYAAITKNYLCRWTDIPKNAPIISYAPLVPVLCAAALKLWHNS